MTDTKQRSYMGVAIHRAATNASGIRWYAKVSGVTLQADSLDVIERLIKVQLELYQ